MEKNTTLMVITGMARVFSGDPGMDHQMVGEIPSCKVRQIIDINLRFTML